MLFGASHWGEFLLDEVMRILSLSSPEHAADTHVNHWARPCLHSTIPLRALRVLRTRIPVVDRMKAR